MLIVTGALALCTALGFMSAWALVAFTFMGPVLYLYDTISVRS
jgi:hypothetical protein